MSALLPSQKINVYLETEDGSVFTGQAYAAAINVNLNPSSFMDFRGFTKTVSGNHEWSMDLVGTGEPLWVRTKDDAVEDLHSALEWRCPWCGGIMPREYRQCTQCGGFRSFVYDLMD